MIKVYRITIDVNNFQYFLSEREQEGSNLIMDCTRKAEGWIPPSVYIYKPKHQKGDFFNFGSSTLIAGPKATEVLHHFFMMAGELLPLPYEGEVYTLINVTECINCLDQEQTEWIYGQSTGAKVGISRYAFHRDRFSESDIFKIPETCKGEILVVEGLKDFKDEFRYAVTEAGLNGLIFEEIWQG